MKPNYRRGEHLDISTQPWLGAPVSLAPLAKLRARIDVSAVESKLRDALRSYWKGKLGPFICVHASSKKPALSLFVAGTLMEMTKEALITLKHEFISVDSIEDVSIEDLQTVPILQLGQEGRTPQLFVLAATWRTIVEARPGVIPGLNNGMTLAGLHFTLNQLGFETTEN